ncbi:hypothetical protein H5410_057031 [Solanum commersonii]|uniref:Uncharacterized protein n=1 Tax=Solanum commersonii TaxID=4109 RepID=A0A9J5WLU5_SOLCO|nr:hypothetical protein H5410_057031 [Solanum commersonii]
MNYDGAPRYDASRKMSQNTPPAVTSAPAPGPRTIRGCFAYLSVVNAIMLSDPESCANGCSLLSNWKQRKGDILNQLAALEAIQEQRALTDDEALQKSNLAIEFEEVARNEEIAWRRINNTMVETGRQKYKILP